MGHTLAFVRARQREGRIMGRYNLVSLAGLAGLMAIAWALSTNRRRLNVRCVAAGVGLQLLLGLIVFRWPGSRAVFLHLNDAVLKLLDAAKEGQRFLFGVLAVGPGEAGPQGEQSIGFILAVQALPIIIFFSGLMGLLYHWRIMPLVIRGFAWVFTRFMRVSGAESLCAASNIFVGIESATTIRPYLARMTRSEFCTVLTAGMATVASSTLTVYVLYLKDTFETIAGHLISASILSAPAAIVMSKLLVPEEDVPATLGRRVEPYAEPASGSIDAVIHGATAGVKLVAGICALLIAFLGLIAVVDLLLGWLGGRFGAALSLKGLLGWAMWPFAVLMGVPPSDAAVGGRLLGERLVATEIPAYQHLAEAIGQGAFQHDRSPVVLAYALCGFAHVASLAIFVGGVAALVPERRKDVAAVGPRALLAATLACLATGCVAGMFHSGALTAIGSPTSLPATALAP